MKIVGRNSSFLWQIRSACRWSQSSRHMPVSESTLSNGITYTCDTSPPHTAHRAFLRSRKGVKVALWKAHNCGYKWPHYATTTRYMHTRFSLDARMRFIWDIVNLYVLTCDFVHLSMSSGSFISLSGILKSFFVADILRLIKIATHAQLDN